MFSPLLRILQILVISAPAVFFGWLLWQELVPSGTFVVTKTPGISSPFVDRVLPDARVRSPEHLSSYEWVQPIIGDPAFFFVHPHRSFKTVEAEVRFRNDENVPIVEFGARANAPGETYDLRPLQNLLIDHSSWDRLEKDGMVLLQRKHIYDSLEDFLSDPPARATIATYHFTLEKLFRLVDVQPSPQRQILDVSLRGPHEFFTYIKDETLRFDFGFMDMNRKEGGDSVRIVLVNEKGVPLADRNLGDDGNVSEDREPSGMRTLRLEVPNLPEGVYKVQLQAESDIFFRRIATRQRYVTFLNHLTLGDEAGYREPSASVQFWTDASVLRFSTQHADAVQDVSVGSDSVSIPMPFQEVRHRVTQTGLVSVNVPEGDVIVNSDGLFAFSQDQYFDPDPTRLTSDTDLDRLGVNYIVAKYVPPRQEGDWLVANVSFDPSVLSFDKETWKFVVSLPGIQDTGKTFLLGPVKLTLRRDPLTWEWFVGEIRERLGM
ncbi:MAG TPA: hypothetical protein VJB99_03245 [Patescibacteria group bacterium]|nr:hypothetical protein [Patescibacteria group bacterium]